MLEAEVIALLSKTYIKEGLTRIDRYHAKLGDIGIKAMKKALPSLKIPKQYRCEFCIEGKIHRFGHTKKEVTRIEYDPGVCIHSDHSGPYARSLGGHRYSQIVHGHWIWLPVGSQNAKENWALRGHTCCYR